ncbi:MAG: GNAT family N-acetyltransferase [Bacteroidota bacterium]
MMSYLFKSARLGFRIWEESDIEKMALINADAVAMEFLPSTRTLRETKAFINKMQKMYAEKGYCYFAVDLLEDNSFIGFIGLAEQTYKADFTPCIDVGWRLAKKYWDKGYATEGAKKCLKYGFDELGLSEIFAVAPVINNRSINVMKKIGMVKVKEFIHPQLIDNERLRDCVLYKSSGN